MMNSTKDTFTSTRNACRLCTPLGACLAFRGVAGAMPFIHGSQGCATYIRRYLIGHFREPMDIACSSFSEEAAVFGGERNLATGLENVLSQYEPTLIGVASTCLTETIGDDVSMYLKRFYAERTGKDLPPIVSASTPSYHGSHADGFLIAVRELVNTLAELRLPNDDLSTHATGTRVNLFINMISPEDIRHLREILRDFGVEGTILPDFSEALDGAAWNEYHLIPPGGTTVDEIRQTGSAAGSIEFGSTIPDALSGAKILDNKFGVKAHRIGLPIGIKQCDAFCDAMTAITGKAVPEKILAERGRLIDSFVDGHKYLFCKKAVVYGTEDMVAAMATFLTETGVEPILCASGGTRGNLKETLATLVPDHIDKITVMENADFSEIEETIESMAPDMLIGNSNGAKIARKMNVPLVRVELPIHDRMGASRIMHVGYRGTQQLYDRIANAMIEVKQESSPVGYTHM